MKRNTELILNNFFKKYNQLKSLKQPIKDAIELIVSATLSNNKILVCGNGGSCADSEHISGELLKSFMLKRKLNNKMKSSLIKHFGEEGEYIANHLQEGVKCIPLTSFNAFNTAFSNDCEPSMNFAQLVNVLGDKNDILISISTSGNSKNVLLASKVAKAKEIKVIALTGESGGKLKDCADILINAPSNIVYEIQEYHLPIYHLICLCVETEIFDE